MNTYQGIETTDIMTKVNSYMEIFGPSLRLFRRKSPNNFMIELEKLKAIANDPERSNTNNSVEMICMCKVDYEYALLSGNVSVFSSDLLNFAKSNGALVEPGYYKGLSLQNQA